MVDTQVKPSEKTHQSTTAPDTAPDIWRPFSNLRREVERLFDEFDWGMGRYARRIPREVAPFLHGGPGAPAVDIAERDTDYQVTAELPGLTADQIEVKVSGDKLTVKGEKKEEKEEERKGYHLSERRYGAFERSFRLPDGIAAEGIEARFADGVLTVTLPKTSTSVAAERKVAINTG